MGKINKIYLNNYRNFKSCKITFNSGSNIFYGLNGSGKTNLLESISLLGKGRGFRNASLTNLILKKEKKFYIESEFEKDKNIYNLKVYNEEKENKYKKIRSINDEISKDSEDFIDSSLSFLFFLPEMERLFLSTPSFRRNFIDKLIFSENKNYNKLINKYKKNISERSKLLQINNYDIDWLDTIENEITKISLKIYYERNKQIDILNKHMNLINKFNNHLFKATFSIKDNFYNNKIDFDIYKDGLKNSRLIDSKIGGSAIGPHKSDFVAMVDKDTEASQLSTGQQKTLILLILMAQCDYLISNKNIKPILLFDEICSHLDDINRKILLELTDKFDIQFFFTGTDKTLFSFMSTKVNFYNITDL